MTPARISSMGLSVFAAAALLGGCEFIAKKATEKAVETATGNAVSIDGKKIEIKTEDGKTAVIAQNGDHVTIDGPEGKVVMNAAADGELPKDFPIGLPEKTTVVRTTNMDSDKGGKMLSAILKSESSPTTLGDFYKSELEAKGFTVKRTETKAGPMSMVLVAAEKGKIQVGAQIITGAGEDGTMINLSWVEKD